MNAQKRTGLHRWGWAVVAMVAVLLMIGSVTLVSAQTPFPNIQSIGGYIDGKGIQIDDLDNDPLTTPDANMTSNPAVANDRNLPAGVPAFSSYIDWNDLAVQTNGVWGPPPGQYALIDGQGNSDDSFGGTGGSSCLQPAKSPPPKQDVARAYLANNSQYLYFGLVDGTANGSSRHVILFHKNPVVADMTTTCAGDGHEITVQLTPKDRMIVAFFQPSAAEPAGRVFSIADGADLSAPLLMNDAVNFANPALWTQIDTAVNFAVNTTAIPADLLGGDVSLKASVFGEGAVTLSSLGISSCGGSYYVSVVTRTTATGNGEAKDFIGGKYDFGSISVTADLTPSCLAQFGYSAQAKDVGGSNIADADASYAWACKPNTVTPTGKSGTQAAAAGNYACTVTATQISSGCTAQASDAVDVYNPLGVTALLTPSCNMGVSNVDDATYASTVTGGSGSVSTAWTFGTNTSGCSVTPATATTPSGGLDVTPPASRGPCGVNAGVTVTDLRTDLPAGTCTASDDATTTVYAPIKVSIAPTPAAQACTIPGLPGSDNGSIGLVTFGATATGGNGAYTYAWDKKGPDSVGACASASSCGVNIPAANFCALTKIFVTVDDGTVLCGAKDSETESVTKQTLMTISNN